MQDPIFDQPLAAWKALTSDPNVREYQIALPKALLDELAELIRDEDEEGR